MKNILNEEPTTSLNGRLLYTTKFIDKSDIENKAVLNIGCGYGWFELFCLDKSVSKIIGLEITEKDMETARKITQENCEFFVGSAIDLPFESGCFDTVTAWEVIEHIPKNTELKMFEEVKRVLKKDGVFYLSTPNKSFLSNLFDPAWWLIGHRHYSAKMMSSFANIVGFEILRTEIRGGFWNITNVLNLYIAKWIFRRGNFFKSFFDNKENREYEKNRGITNMFIKFKKIEE